MGEERQKGKREIRTGENAGTGRSEGHAEEGRKGAGICRGPCKVRVGERLP